MARSCVEAGIRLSQLLGDGREPASGTTRPTILHRYSTPHLPDVVHEAVERTQRNLDAVQIGREQDTIDRELASHSGTPVKIVVEPLGNGRELHRVIEDKEDGHHREHDFVVIEHRSRRSNGLHPQPDETICKQEQPPHQTAGNGQPHEHDATDFKKDGHGERPSVHLHLIRRITPEMNPAQRRQRADVAYKSLIGVEDKSELHDLALIVLQLEVNALEAQLEHFNGHSNERPGLEERLRWTREALEGNQTAWRAFFETKSSDWTGWRYNMDVETRWSKNRSSVDDEIEKARKISEACDRVASLNITSIYNPLAS